MDAKLLIDASVYVNDQLIPIIPGSLKTTPATGEVNARALSLGGDNIEMVAGLDASSLLEDVKFEVAVTDREFDIVEDWKIRSKKQLHNTIRLSWPDREKVISYTKAAFVNSPEAEHSSDGNISCEFKAVRAVD